jgi:hypothetical protein
MAAYLSSKEKQRVLCCRCLFLRAFKGAINRNGINTMFPFIVYCGCGLAQPPKRWCAWEAGKWGGFRWADYGPSGLKNSHIVICLFPQALFCLKGMGLTGRLEFCR